jgi:hypothetical protein
MGQGIFFSHFKENITHQALPEDGQKPDVFGSYRQEKMDKAFLQYILVQTAAQNKINIQSEFYGYGVMKRQRAAITIQSIARGMQARGTYMLQLEVHPISYAAAFFVSVVAKSTMSPISSACRGTTAEVATSQIKVKSNHFGTYIHNPVMLVTISNDDMRTSRISEQ